MRRGQLPFVVVVCAALAGSLLNAQTKSPSIEGVWQIASVVTTGANATNISKAQPSLLIFTKDHYSWISVNSDAPRKNVTVKDASKPTEAEKLALFDMWRPFTAQAGTYQLNGTTLTRRPTVAKNVGVMTATTPNIDQARLEGNKLTLIAKSAAGQPVSQTTTVLTRVE